MLVWCFKIPLLSSTPPFQNNFVDEPEDVDQVEMDDHDLEMNHLESDSSLVYLNQFDYQSSMSLNQDCGKSFEHNVLFLVIQLTFFRMLHKGNMT